MIYIVSLEATSSTRAACRKNEKEKKNKRAKLKNIILLRTQFTPQPENQEIKDNLSDVPFK